MAGFLFLLLLDMLEPLADYGLYMIISEGILDIAS
jgi:hypothetical protein